MRNALGTALLVAAALVLALALAEAAVRLAGLVPATDDEPAAQPLDPALRGLPILDQEIGQPNVRGIHYGVLHRTNSRGVRGPEYAPEPPPGSYRIVLVGDSFAMGHRVAESDTYAARLERSLDTAGAGVRFEVINAGLSGLSIGPIVDRLERIGLPYHPHLIVYGFSANDIYGPAYRPNTPEEREAFERARERFADSPLHLLRAAWPRWISLRSALHPLPGSHEYALTFNYTRNPEAWRAIEDGLDRLARISRERDVCIHVFIHSVMHELGVLHPFRPIYDQVQRAAEERGLTVTQSLPGFAGRRATRLRFGPRDNHPTAEGHALLARALERGLRRLPARCGFPLPARAGEG